MNLGSKPKECDPCTDREHNRFTYYNRTANGTLLPDGWQVKLTSCELDAGQCLVFRQGLAGDGPRSSEEFSIESCENALDPRGIDFTSQEEIEAVIPEGQTFVKILAATRGIVNLFQKMPLYKEDNRFPLQDGVDPVIRYYSLTHDTSLTPADLKRVFNDNEYQPFLYNCFWFPSNAYDCDGNEINIPNFNPSDPDTQFQFGWILDITGTEAKKINLYFWPVQKPRYGNSESINPNWNQFYTNDKPYEVGKPLTLVRAWSLEKTEDDFVTGSTSIEYDLPGLPECICLVPITAPSNTYSTLDTVDSGYGPEPYCLARSKYSYITADPDLGGSPPILPQLDNTKGFPAICGSQFNTEDKPHSPGITMDFNPIVTYTYNESKSCNSAYGATELYSMKGNPNAKPSTADHATKWVDLPTTLTISHDEIKFNIWSLLFGVPCIYDNDPIINQVVAGTGNFAYVQIPYSTSGACQNTLVAYGLNGTSTNFWSGTSGTTTVTLSYNSSTCEWVLVATNSVTNLTVTWSAIACRTIPFYYPGGGQDPIEFGQPTGYNTLITIPERDEIAYHRLHEISASTSQDFSNTLGYCTEYETLPIIDLTYPEATSPYEDNTPITCDSTIALMDTGIDIYERSRPIPYNSAWDKGIPLIYASIKDSVLTVEFRIQIPPMSLEKTVEKIWMGPYWEPCRIQRQWDQSYVVPDDTVGVTLSWNSSCIPDRTEPPSYTGTYSGANGRLTGPIISLVTYSVNLDAEAINLESEYTLSRSTVTGLTSITTPETITVTLTPTEIHKKLCTMPAEDVATGERNFFYDVFTVGSDSFTGLSVLEVHNSSGSCSCANFVRAREIEDFIEVCDTTNQIVYGDGYVRLRGYDILEEYGSLPSGADVAYDAFHKDGTFLFNINGELTAYSYSSTWSPETTPDIYLQLDEGKSWIRIEAL